MTTRGILFFNHGQRCLARLAVSLYSLRQHYDGPAVILDTGESGGIVERIAADERLAVEVERIPFKSYRRHSAYVAKAGLWKFSPFRTASLLVDSDTVFAGDPTPLIEASAHSAGPGLVATQFADWVSTGSIVSGRIRQWEGVEVRAESGGMKKGIDVAALVRESLAEPWPAINTGVLGFASDKQVLRDWERLTVAGAKCSFTDELALQILLRKHRHVLVDDRYNCSPIYGVNKTQAVIWHCHGKKHLAAADGRGREGEAIWWPAFQAAWQADIGGLRRWAPAGDERLAERLAVAGLLAGV